MKIFNRIRICSKVGMHAWYDTDLGFAIRKPIGSVERPRNEIDRILLPQEIEMYRPWWQKFWNFIKRILHI